MLSVYDSNLIRSETSSYTNELHTNHSQSNSVTAGTALALELNVEMEEEMKMDDWMLEPFNVVTNLPEYVEVEKEQEHMEVEPWMTDLSIWK